MATLQKPISELVTDWLRECALGNYDTAEELAEQVEAICRERDDGQ